MCTHTWQRHGDSKGWHCILCGRQSRTWQLRPREAQVRREPAPQRAQRPPLVRI